MDYKMSKTEKGLNIILEVSNDNKTKLLEEFSNCQQGKCSCPTEEYKKLESLTVENFENKISLTLKPKADQNFDINEINKCLSYTLNKVEGDK